MNTKVRGLHDGEMDAMCALVVRAFAEKGVTAAQVARAAQVASAMHADPALNRVVEMDGRLVARLYIHDRAMCCDGGTLRVGAIGGVCVDPAYRRRGLCGLLLDEATTFMEHQGFDVSLLFGLPAVYGQAGWQSLVAAGLSSNVPLSALSDITVRRADMCADGVALQSLHRQFTAALTGPLVRTADYWTRWVRYMLAADAGLQVWMVLRAEQPLGYFVNHLKSPAVVNELAWMRGDATALAGVLGAIFSAVSDDTVRFQTSLPELRAALTDRFAALTFDDFRRAEFRVAVTAQYAGLFKLVKTSGILDGTVRDTAALLDYLRRNDYAFWWLIDHF